MQHFPVTLFYEFELLFEPLLTVLLLTWVVFTGAIYFIAFMFGSKQNSKVALLFVPSYFLLSYILTFVEVNAMYKSLQLLFVRKDIVWQRWDRKGIPEALAVSEKVTP